MLGKDPQQVRRPRQAPSGLGDAGEHGAPGLRSLPLARARGCFAGLFGKVELPPACPGQSLRGERPTGCGRRCGGKSLGPVCSGRRDAWRDGLRGPVESERRLWPSKLVETPQNSFGEHDGAAPRASPQPREPRITIFLPVVVRVVMYCKIRPPDCKFWNRLAGRSGYEDKRALTE